MRRVLITVATYNVHRCIGRDGRRDPARTAQVIRELDADLVALQEVETRHGEGQELHRLEYLAEQTGLHPIPGPTLFRPDSSFGNAILSRWRPLRVRSVDLSVDDRREPRGAIDVDLVIGGVPAQVIATHLGLRWWERRRQGDRLFRALDGNQAPFRIMLGDINEWLPVSRLVRRFDHRFGRTPYRRTFPSGTPVWPLDRIWVHPPGAIAELEAVRTPLARIASDHLPLRARIRLV